MEVNYAKFQLNGSQQTEISWEGEVCHTTTVNTKSREQRGGQQDQKHAYIVSNESKYESAN
jgi:hypothetical protein